MPFLESEKTLLLKEGTLAKFLHTIKLETEIFEQIQVTNTSI